MAHIPGAPEWRFGRIREAGAVAACLCVPAILAAVTYANTLPNAFAYDDVDKIRWLSESTMALPSHLAGGRGLTQLFHAIDYRLWGPWAPGYHLTNLLLHAIASVLVAWLALRLSGRRMVSLLGGALFAVHPVHAEAVDSFTNRKDILAAIFVLLALAAWLHRRQRIVRYLGGMSAFLLALLSKEAAAVALVAMFVLADVLGLPREPGRPPSPWRRALAHAWPILLPGLVGSLWWMDRLRGAFAPETIFATTEMHLRSYGEVLANSTASVMDAARLLAFPRVLSADYPVRVDLGLLDWRVLGGALLAAAWITLCALLWRRHAAAAFAAVWVVVLYLPVCNLVPLTQYFVAERYLYVPSIGWCWLVAMAVDGAAAWLRSRTGGAAPVLLGVAAAALVLSGAARTRDRNRDWHDDLSLWRAAAETGIDTMRVHTNLGKELARLGRYEEAVVHLRRAVALAPRVPQPRRYLATALFALNRFDEAAVECRQLLVLRPGDAVCHEQLGQAAMRAGDRVTALDQFRQALAADPGRAVSSINMAALLAHSGTGRGEAVAMAQSAVAMTDDAGGELNATARRTLISALLAEGKDDQAARECLAVLRRNPHDVDATFVLGELALKGGRTTDAIARFRETLASEPRHVGALVNLAWLVATPPESGEEAVRLAERACRVHGIPRALHLKAVRVLARALSLRGRASEAAAQCAIVLREAPEDAFCSALVGRGAAP